MKHLLMILLSIVLISCGKKEETSTLAPPPQVGSANKAPAAPGVPTAPSTATTPSTGMAAAPDAVAKQEKANVLDEMKMSQLQEFYNPSGKRDPFKPFEGGEIVYSAFAKAPLERFELNQLELTAIVWGIARPKVLFRAPDGYSYIAQVGTGIGRNRGRITKVTKNKVLIAEEFRDPSGQYVARESEFLMEQEEQKKTDTTFQETQLKYSDE
jgi:Tfp pilus assembly protein PilP